VKEEAARAPLWRVLNMCTLEWTKLMGVADASGAEEDEVD
jgi:hypothetical protein